MGTVYFVLIVAAAVVAAGSRDGRTGSRSVGENQGTAPDASGEGEEDA